MTTRRSILSSLLLTATLVLLTSGCARPSPTTRSAPPSPAPSVGGAVASAEPVASGIGIDLLHAGGNAADAAVAVALALAVVHPQAGNLGGGGFAVARAGGRLMALDFRETAPAAARPDMFLDPQGKLRPDTSFYGGLAAGVPGSPAGLYALHRRLGRLPWQRVVTPAERLARDGFRVTARLHDAIEEEKELLARFPEIAAVWMPGGRSRDEGETVRLPDLADTLRAYGDRGPEAITGGPIAAAIAGAARQYGGVLTTADLAAYEPAWREPLRFSAFGWRFASMPLPSSGGVIVAQGMAMLERLGWDRLPPGSADRAHLLAEVWRRSYADRYLLGDPRTTEATLHSLLDPAWIATRVDGIDRLTASLSAGIMPWPGRNRTILVEGDREPGATTHLSVIDGAGDLVALTTTLNGWFGCGVHVPGAGFVLNNEMDDFVTAPGHPNYFGLIQGVANAVGPGKRMLSSMSPVLGWRGTEAIVIGSPGGSRIPTATMQVLLDLIVDGQAAASAVERPRIHHQWLPDQILMEKDALSPEARAELVRRGHLVKDATWRIGEVGVARILADGGREAAADSRGPGGAAVEPGHP